MLIVVLCVYLIGNVLTTNLQGPIPIMRTHQLMVLLFLVLLAGCKSSQPEETMTLESMTASRVSFTETTDALEPDPEVEGIIAPYRDQLADRIAEVIGEATGVLNKDGRYETTLGNMAADAMLHVINKNPNAQVDIALTNNGGLRVPIQPGPITVGKMFELMPFENMMVILEYDAAGIDTLAQQIARSSGAISGMSFTVTESETAIDINVGGQPLAEGQTYRLVTSDYLANGGGGITILRNPKGRTDTPMLLRDAFIEYVVDTKTITPTLDGRIQIQTPTNSYSSY